MSTIQIVVTDPETGRTTTETVKAKNSDELNTKIKDAYSKCVVEVKELR